MATVAFKVYQGWEAISWKEIDLDYKWIFPYSILIVTSFLPMGLEWKLCLRMYESDVPYLPSLKISLKSQLGKYIPGKIGLVFTKVIESAKYDIPKQKALAASAFQVGVQLYALSIVSLFSVVFVFRELVPLAPLHYYLLGLVLVIGFLVLRPRSFVAIVNKVFLLMGQEPLKAMVSGPLFWKVVILNIAMISISGTANFFLIKTVFPIGFDLMLYVICIGTLAFLLGLISIFAPSGIGVRESVWIYTLTPIIPAPIAVIVAFLLRAGVFVIEWLMIGLAYLVKDKYVTDADKG